MCKKLKFNFDNLFNYFNKINRYQYQRPVDTISMIEELELEVYSVDTSEDILKDKDNKYIAHRISSDKKVKRIFI